MPDLYGAYGLAFAGCEEAGDLLVPVAPRSEVVAISRLVGTDEPEGNEITDDRARLALGEGGGLTIERSPAAAVFTTPFPIGTGELVHPYLAPVGGIFAWWLGREALHAGAFVAGGKAWGVIGDKEAGKSSALAWLAVQGVPIVCDDMLVIDQDGRVLVGPRCLDLRPPTADRLGVGTRVDVHGPRERWRMEVGPVPEGVPFGGWVLLDWGDQVSLEPLRPSDRLTALAGNRSVMLESRNPTGLLDLVEAPAWRFVRPRHWDLLDEAMTALLDTVG